MQVSFDPTNQDERDAVLTMLESIVGENGETETGPKAKRRSKKADAPAIPPSLPPVAPVAALSSPAPIAAQPMPGFTPPAPAVAAAPVAQAPSPAPVAPAQSSGVTKVQVTQAIQAFTSQYKVTAAKQRLSEFAQAYGLAEPLAIDAIPEAMYAQAIEAFKVG